MNNTWLTVRIVFIAILLSVMLTGAVNAEEKQNKEKDEKWKFLVEPYFWLPEVPLTTRDGDRVKIDQEDILDSLDGALMLLLGAHKNNWSFYLDTIYADLEGDDTGSLSLAGVPSSVRTELDILIRAWIITPTVGYAVVDNDRTRLELLGGIRYYQEKIGFEVDVGPLSAKESDTFYFWDGVVGVKGTTKFLNNWALEYRADVGSGDTNGSYQLFGAVDYKFKAFALSGGYRYMEWKFEKSTFPGEVVEKQVAKGPFMGLKFTF